MKDEGKRVNGGVGNSAVGVTLLTEFSLKRCCGCKSRRFAGGNPMKSIGASDSAQPKRCRILVEAGGVEISRHTDYT